MQKSYSDMYLSDLNNSKCFQNSQESAQLFLKIIIIINILCMHVRVSKFCDIKPAHSCQIQFNTLQQIMFHVHIFLS